MPWLSIIMFLVSYLLSKKAGLSDTQALGVGLVAGAATYGVTHYTDWLGSDINALDGVNPSAAANGGAAVVGPNNQPVVDPSTSKPLSSGGTTSVGRLLVNWGAPASTLLAGAGVGAALGGMSTGMLLLLAAGAFLIITR